MSYGHTILPTPRGILGVGLSILGVGIVFYEGLGVKGTSLLGDCLVLLAAMGFGAYTVLSMPVLERRSPLAVATYSLLFGGLAVLLLSAVYLAGLEWGSVGMGAWAAVAFSAIFATAFAFSAWQTGISRIGANRVLVYQYLITVTGGRIGHRLLWRGTRDREADRRGGYTRGRVPGPAPVIQMSVAIAR